MLVKNISFLLVTLTLFLTLSGQKKNNIPIHPLGIFSLDSGTEWLGQIFDSRMGDNVKLVGLGEVLHGGKELSQLKAKAVQYLVEKRGFRIFLFEYPNASLSLLDYYLKAKKLNSTDTLKMIASNALAGSLYDQSFIALMRWFKQFNLQHPGDMISVKGFDLSGAAGSFANYFMYNFNYLLDTVTKKSIDENWNKVPVDSTAKVLLNWFYKNRDRIEKKKSPHYQEFLYNVKNAELALRHSALKKEHFYYAAFFRDSVMATNIKELSCAKSVIWAHNLHITPWANYSAGKILKNIFDNSYYTILTDFSGEAGAVVKKEGSFIEEKFKPGRSTLAYQLSSNSSGIVFFNEMQDNVKKAAFVNAIGNDGADFVLGPVFDALIILNEITPSSPAGNQPQ